MFWLQYFDPFSGASMFRTNPDLNGLFLHDSQHPWCQIIPNAAWSLMEVDKLHVLCAVKVHTTSMNEGACHVESCANHKTTRARVTSACAPVTQTWHHPKCALCPHVFLQFMICHIHAMSLLQAVNQLWNMWTSLAWFTYFCTENCLGQRTTRVGDDCNNNNGLTDGRPLVVELYSLRIWQSRPK